MRAAVKPEESNKGEYPGRDFDFCFKSGFQESAPDGRIDREDNRVMPGRVMLDQVADFREMKADTVRLPDQKVVNQRNEEGQRPEKA